MDYEVKGSGKGEVRVWMMPLSEIGKQMKEQVCRKKMLSFFLDKIRNTDRQET